MRVIMQMMDQQQAQEASKNNTLEINIKHPIILGINRLRKNDAKKASLVAKMMMDNVMFQAGIPFDVVQSVGRNNQIMSEYLSYVTDDQKAEEIKIEFDSDKKE